MSGTNPNAIPMYDAVLRSNTTNCTVTAGITETSLTNPCREDLQGHYSLSEASNKNLQP